MGRKFGVHFSGITLFIFGGAARMDSEIPNAKSELWMALAGPAASLLLSVGCFVLAIVTELLGQDIIGFLFGLLMVINLILAIFNLVPAFPTDGGRVLRAIVWASTKNYVLATKVAGYLGVAFGWLFIVAGVAMCFGINVPVFGTGIGDGIWIGVIGFLIQWMAKAEVKRSQVLRVH
jgi:Zn-dependent protease